MNESKKEITRGAKVLAAVSLLSAGLLVVAANLVANVSAENDQHFDKVVSVAAGHNFSEVLTDKGEVWVRGQNNYGQLAVGDTLNRSDWTKVTLEKKISKLSTQYDHSVALATDGTLYTWGDNQSSIAADGSTGLMVQPKSVTAAYRFEDISAGSNFIVALSRGNLYVWGDNSDGQLGTGTTEDSPSPVMLGVGMTFKQVKAGKNFAFALDVNNHLWSWGVNSHGQLGNGNTTNVNVPTQISDQQFKFLNTNLNSEAVVAIDTKGFLYSWGDNTFGQIGIGVDWRRLQLEENQRVADQINAIKASDALKRQGLINQCILDKQDQWNKDNPVIIPPVDPISPSPSPSASASPSASPSPTPAPVMPDYTAECTSSVDSTFKPTDTSKIVPRVISEPSLQPDSLSPQLVTKSVKFTFASVGSQNGYAIDVNGKMYGWGSDENGQSGIGVNEKTHTQVPVVVAAGTSFTQVVGANQWASAIGKNGDLYTWGLNTNKSLASDAAEPVLSPTSVGSGFKAIYAGVYTGIAITSSGETASWGDGLDFLLGTKPSGSRASVKGLGINLSKVSVSNKSAVALDANGYLYVWGENTANTFGNRSATSTIYETPTQQSISKFKEIATGRLFTVVTDEYDNAWSWGSSASGQVGPFSEGQATNHPVIVPVAGKVEAVGASELNGYALTKDGVLSIWGGANNDSSIRTQKLTMKVKKVTANRGSVILLDTDGHIWTTGSSNQPVSKLNDEVYLDVSGAGNGMLALNAAHNIVAWNQDGNPTLLNKKSGGVINDKDKNNYLAISGSNDHALAVDSQGVVWAWGIEPYGTFGSTKGDTKSFTAIPVKTEKGK